MEDDRGHIWAADSQGAYEIPEVNDIKQIETGSDVIYFLTNDGKILYVDGTRCKDFISEFRQNHSALLSQLQEITFSPDFQTSNTHIEQISAGKGYGFSPNNTPLFNYQHLLARDSNGMVWAMGSNNAGQLGNGKTDSDPQEQFAPVEGLSDVEYVSAGRVSSFAIKNDDSIWFWGHDGYLQAYPNDNTFKSSVPVQIYGDESYIPNNTGELLWPVDSYEVTLWFGPIDEQYPVENKGMNIQGTTNSQIYSVCEGIVSFTGYSPIYGNVIYVNFNYDGYPMQVRYGHLTDSSSLTVGQHIYKGDAIGRMAEDPERGKGVIEIVFCKSTDGRVCKNTGENIEFVEPTLYIDKKTANSVDYLSEPFATVLDTTGLVVSKSTPNMIWPWEDKKNPDVRYKEDVDLTSNQGYLRKLLGEYGKDIDKTITSKNLEQKNILAYSDQYKLAIVNLNSRTKWYRATYGNGVIKNNRMVVDKEQLWHDLIGNTYNCEEGGTWTASKVTNSYVFVYQQIYIPKAIADYLYFVTDGGQVEKELMDLIVSSAPGATEALIKHIFIKYGINISTSYIGYFISGAMLFNDISEAVERDNFRNACIQCGANEYVRISRMVTDYAGIINAYEIVSEIKDVYRSRGTFQLGYYDGLKDIDLQGLINEK